MLLVNKKSDENSVTLYEFAFSWGNLLGMSVATKGKNYDLEVIAEGYKKEAEAQQSTKHRNDKFYFEKKSRQEIESSIERKLEASAHKRISPYFRLFTQFFNYGTWTLVAHREYISIFDMRANGDVKKHI